MLSLCILYHFIEWKSKKKLAYIMVKKSEGRIEWTFTKGERECSNNETLNETANGYQCTNLLGISTINYITHDLQTWINHSSQVETMNSNSNKQKYYC